MAAIVTEAIPHLPPYLLHECLKVAGMSTASATRFMESHNLVTIEDMLWFCPRKSQDLTKIYNRQQTS